MSGLQRKEMFKRYQETWRNMQVLSFVALVLWVFPWYIDRFTGGTWYALLPPVWIWFLAAPVIRVLFFVSPMLAWVFARRHLSRHGAFNRASRNAYRSAPECQQWAVSGPFPGWAVGMCAAWLFLVVCEGLLEGGKFVLDLSLTSIISGNTRKAIDVTQYLVCVPEGVAHVWLLYVWWTGFRRDAARVGMIVRTTKRGLVLRTARGSRRVTVVPLGNSKRGLRLDAWGASEEWHTVEPVTDLIRPTTKGATL